MGSMAKHWYVPLMLMFALASLAMGCSLGNEDEHDDIVSPDKLANGSKLIFNGESSWLLDSGSSPLNTTTGISGTADFKFVDKAGNVSNLSGDWVYSKEGDEGAKFEYTVTSTDNDLDGELLDITMDFDSVTHGDFSVTIDGDRASGRFDYIGGSTGGDDDDDDDDGSGDGGS